MRNDVAPADDQDSLYILPLSNIPLETRGLRKARLVKTPRLEGVVELFSGSNTGSGHIAPNGLYSMFDFGEEPHPDVEMIRKLSVLPSYDVYSLRRQLRRMGIEVDDVATLQLSPERADELSKYMQVFTRPLIHAVYGHRDMGELNHAKIVDLFRDPDISIARQNIMNLSAKLNRIVKRLVF